MVKDRGIDLDGVYKNYRNKVLGYVISNSGSTEDGEDILHDSMIDFMKRLEDEDFELTCAPETYLFSIAKNLWYKKLLRKRTHNRNENNIIYNTEIIGNNNYESLETSEIIQKCMNGLSDTHRQLLDLSYFKEMNMTDIAKLLGYKSCDTAKSIKYTAKKKFTKVLNKYYDKEDLVY